MSDYSNVPIHTGAPVQQGNVAMANAVQTHDNLIATEQTRAVAEVQAALVIAAGRPRNEIVARDKLINACGRVSLANVAVYQYSRGGSAVSGPSIRLAETAARYWGNMNYGFRELSRRPGESECEAYCWDLETNVKAVRQFSVKHKRDTKKGSYAITDERDIYELMANHAQRRVRACILEIVPGDIIEEAVTACERTLKANIGNVAEAAKGLVDAFAKVGVSREAIEKRLGCRIDAIQPGQVVKFREIYVSIKDGMSEPKDWFELDAGKEDAKPAPQKAAAIPAAEQPQTIDAPAQEPAKPAAKKGRAQGPSAPLTQPPMYGATPEQQQEPTTPDPFPPAADPSLIDCPNGVQVTDADCAQCSSRPGCPAWDEAI